MSKKTLALVILTSSLGLFYSCSSDEEFFSEQIETENTLTTRTIHVKDSIIPFEGDRDTLKRPIQLFTSEEVKKEIDQLEDIPFYLQVQGNSSTKQNLSVSSAGTEVTVEEYSDHIRQQFYIKVPSAITGIPYLIYSKATNTVLKVGTYTSDPNTKVLYADYTDSNSFFGASWDFRRGTYSNNSFVIENQDLPEQGNSGNWMDIYYPAITVNDSKVSFSKYNNSPYQEFAIVPVEDFEVESIRYITDASAVLEGKPELLYKDTYTNNGPIQQTHKFTISESYKETSNFQRKTSYNVNISSTFKTKVPFIASGEITTSVTEGQDFTYGESEEHTITINREYPIDVPAYYVAELTLTILKYNMDVEYVATCRGLISGKKLEIRGIWTGVDVVETNAVADVTPINGGKSTRVIITDEMLKSKVPIRVK